MAENATEIIRGIINEPRLQRYFRFVSKLTGRQDLLDGDPLAIAVDFILAILTNRWPQKQMQQYLLRFLDIEPVMTNIIKWRCSDKKGNILHFACRNGRIPVIETIIKQCNDEFFNELDADQRPPLFYLKFNTVNNWFYKSMKDILRFFIIKTNHAEAILKQCLLDVATCSFSFIIACFEQYEDYTKIDENIITPLLKYYLRDIPAWRRCRFWNISASLPNIKLSHEASVDLLQVFKPIESQYHKIHYTRQNGRYHCHILYVQHEILTLIINHLDFNVISLEDYALLLGVIHRHRFDNGHDLKTLRSAISSSIRGIFPAKRKTSIKESKVLWQVNRTNRAHAIEAQQNFQMDKRTKVTDLFNELPSEIIAVVMSYLPYEALMAAKISSKQFYQIYLTIPDTIVWQRKFEKAFPFDAKPKEYSKQSYFTRYNNKFKAKNSGWIDLNDFPYEARTTLALHQNVISICHAEDMSLYDLETKQWIKYKSEKQIMNGNARKLGDTLYVAGNVGLELHSLSDHKSTGILKTGDITQFDVNDKWILSNAHLWDTASGKIIAQLDTTLFQARKLLLRGDMAITWSTHQCTVSDVRTGLDPIEILEEESSTIYVSDNYMYMVKPTVEIRDLRKLNEPVWILPLAIDHEHDFAILNMSGTSSLPNEILIEVSTQLSFYDLARFESTSKYWLNYFRGSNSWEKHYGYLNNGKDISKLPMNFWWQAEELSAKRFSTLLNVDRASRKAADRALDYTTPPYKSYITTLLDHKSIIRKDLEWIHAREDLLFHEKALAEKLYWTIHTNFPRINFAIDTQEVDYWDSEDNRRLFPEELQDLADSKPLFYWDDAEGDNYMQYVWLFWLRSDSSITMYLAMFRSIQRILDERQVIHFKIEEFEQKKHDFLFDLPTGEYKDQLSRFQSVQKSIKTMQHREAIYLSISSELSWRLDVASKSVIESVNVSNVKHRCDAWLSGLDPKPSNNAKAAVIKCLRRVLWYLLKKEILQHSLCAPAVYVKSRAAWQEKYHDNKTDHMPPKYWALFLIEKAYYCVDPLTELLIQLLRNEATTDSQRKLIALNVDRNIMEKAVLLFHTKE